MRHFRRFCQCLLVSLAGFGCAVPVHAGEVRVAVASNFAATLRELAQHFEAISGHKLTLIAGSSGKIYAQITQGAPFDVFLSADEAKPAALVKNGLALAESRFTYAQGVLVLWSAKGGLVNAQTLRASNSYRHLAMANPKLAPYGVAAGQLLGALGLRSDVEAKLVLGENVQQAFQFVASGNAQLGLVALSQFYDYKDKRGDDGGAAGAVWLVPSEHYQAIRQDAVLLERAATNPAAIALLQYLRSEDALGIIVQRGYKH